MNDIKLWPHVTLIALACALLGGIAAAFLVRREPTATAATLPRAARVERVDGQVGLSRSLDNSNFDDQWIEVTPNTPLSVGDRVYARENSQASIAFTGRNFARLEPDSALDVIDLSDDRTQLALRDGSAIFNVGELEEGDLFEVATPHGAFDLRQPGLYEVGLNDDGSAWVSVLSGLAEVVGLAGSGEIGKGEMLTLLGRTAADIALSRISPDYAGGLVDDYYGYQYPDTYDGRYSDYNTYLTDPYYYDPSKRYASYRHVSDDVPGVWELDRYGDWQQVGDHGYAWSPRVEEGWAPYREGRWMMDEPHGLTWVSNEPWGYAPYHYGRWVNSGGRWYWVPEGVNSQPAYAPALVAFVPVAEENVVGWVPLAPGDPYVPTYYDSEWQPHYLTDAPTTLERVANFDVPGAVTLVPFDDFGREVGRDSLARTNREAYGGARPVLDPLSIARLRQAALQAAGTPRRVEMPPGLAKRLDSTQVYTSARPFAPPFREDSSKAMRVEAVPDKQKRQRLQFRDERQKPDAAREQAGAPGLKDKRDRQASPQADTARADGREARRAEQELRRQERDERQDARRQKATPRRDDGAARAADEKALRAAEQRAQGERVAHSRAAEKEAARQQQRQSAASQQQQQRAAMRQQLEARRNADRQAAPQRHHQQQQQRAARQPQQQPREARQPPGQARRQQGPPQQRVEQRRPQPQQSAGPKRQPDQPRGGGGGGGGGRGGGNGKGKGKN